MKRVRRRSWDIFECLIVLLANEGMCVYCEVSRSEVMDHVIPFAEGGADRLANLVPACDSCNRSKGSKSLPEWWMSLNLLHRWHGDGTTMGPHMPLRQMYEEAHEEMLLLFDRLEIVQAEIADGARREWIFDRTWMLTGRTSWDIKWGRKSVESRISEAREQGYPKPPPPKPKRFILGEDGIPRFEEVTEVP